MAIEVGSIVEGTVSGITNFGAFVELPEGKVGLIHISEVADEYVSDVKDFLKEKDKVKVKVLNTNEYAKNVNNMLEAIKNQAIDNWENIIKDEYDQFA